MKKIKIHFQSLSFKKKQFILWLALFIIIGGISLILVALPWVNNKSTFTIMAEKYGDIKNYDSSDIWDLILKVLTWTALVWGIALKIQHTILIKKERKNYMKFFKKQLIEHPNDITKQIEISKRQIDKKIMKNEKLADEYINQLQNAFDYVGLSFKGGFSIEIRSILMNLNLNKDDKIDAILNFFNKSGVNITEFRNIEKAIKDL